MDPANLSGGALFRLKLAENMDRVRVEFARWWDQCELERIAGLECPPPGAKVDKRNE